MSEEVEFYIECILDCKYESDGTKLYLIKWMGHPEEDNTWEPIENLEGALDLVQEFERFYRENLKLAVNSNREKEYFQYENKQLENSSNQKPKRTFAILRNFYFFKCNNDYRESNPFAIKPFLIFRKRKQKNNYPKNRKKRIPKYVKLQAAAEIVGFEKNSGIKAPPPGYQIVKNSTPEILMSTEASEIQEEGHFTFGDRGKSLVFLKVQDDDLVFRVFWLIRRNGVQPKPTQFFAKEIRKFDPFLLLDYYEGKLRFVHVNSTKKPQLCKTKSTIDSKISIQKKFNNCFPNPKYAANSDIGIQSLGDLSFSRVIGKDPNSFKYKIIGGTDIQNLNDSFLMMEEEFSQNNSFDCFSKPSEKIISTQILNADPFEQRLNLPSENSESYHEELLYEELYGDQDEPK